MIAERAPIAPELVAVPIVPLPLPPRADGFFRALYPLALAVDRAAEAFRPAEVIEADRRAAALAAERAAHRAARHPDRAELARRVADLLPRLTERQRRAVALRDLEGLTQAAAAERLGVSIGAVEGARRAALWHLRALVAERDRVPPFLGRAALPIGRGFRTLTLTAMLDLSRVPWWLPDRAETARILRALLEHQRWVGRLPGMAPIVTEVGVPTSTYTRFLHELVAAGIVTGRAKGTSPAPWTRRARSGCWASSKAVRHDGGAAPDF